VSRRWTPASHPTEAAYGHTVADYAVGLAATAGARRVLLFHQHPNRTDDELDATSRRLASAAVETQPAVEGSVIDL